MITKKEQKNRNKLLKLMWEYPDLPIVPMVDGEIPGDDSGRWIGSWGEVYIDEYLLTKNREWMVFKSDGDVFDFWNGICLMKSLKHFQRQKQSAGRYMMHSHGQRPLS